MEIYERINILIKEKKLTKKEFARRLIALEPKSSRTGEIINEKVVYAYLSGRSIINSYYISYIAEALNISEQSLFDNSEKTRIRILKDILQNPSLNENKIIQDYSLKTNNTQIYNICKMLKYSPTPFLDKIEIKLIKFKDISDLSL